MVVKPVRISRCGNGSNGTSLDNGVRLTAEDHHVVVSEVSMGGDDAPVKAKCEQVSPVTERRSSARIQKLNSEKAVRLRGRSNNPEEKVVRKKIRLYERRKGSQPDHVGDDNKSSEGNTNKVVLGSNNNNKSNGCSSNVEEAARVSRSIEVAEETGVGGGKSACALVTETLRSFSRHFLHFVQEEEKRCKRGENDQKTTKGSKSKGSKSKKRNAPEDDTKRSAQRPDLKAITKMTETNAILNPNKRFGSIPGIDVGHKFFSRAEMVVVGFHSHWLNGIDYIGQNGSKDYSGYKLPLAIAIVLSGQYEDDLDNCEDIVYTGQGGNNLLGNRRQVKDQVMERGNLALKNCIVQDTPVRVVRGHKSADSYVGKVYTYDGLYKVVKYWAEKGVSGFTVFKFQLKRVDGQPVLTTNQVLNARGQIPKSIAEIRGLVCEDISGGQENIPIPATNLVDDPPVAPSGFTYCKSLQVAGSVKIPRNATGCDCKDRCTNPKSCACARLNGSDFPYVHRDGGRLVAPMGVVFECGPNCGCGPDCVNRTSQKGMRYRLEVFRTPKKGWGVRSWDHIPSGAPICEYIGKLMKTDDVDTAYENDYIFDIDCLQTMKGLDGRERRLRDVSIPTCLDKSDDHRSDNGPEFCIDACSTGNIARFINHSCQPNLFVQCVLSSHHDIKLARVVLFAADNIPPLKELNYDYGYALDSVMGPDGKVRQLLCYCGAADCRKRLF